MKYHRPTEYLELEGTQKDHWVQLSGERGGGTGDSSLLWQGQLYFPFGSNLHSEEKKVIHKVVMSAQVADGCVTMSEQKTGFNLNERFLPRRRCSVPLVTVWAQPLRSRAGLWLSLLHQYQLLHG